MSGDQGNLSADGRRPGADAVEAGNRIGVDVEPSSLWSDNLARCGGPPAGSWGHAAPLRSGHVLGDKEVGLLVQQELGEKQTRGLAGGYPSIAPRRRHVRDGEQNATLARRTALDFTHCCWCALRGPNDHQRLRGKKADAAGSPVFSFHYDKIASIASPALRAYLSELGGINIPPIGQRSRW